MNGADTFDIIICGAGPAGSTCALAAAGAGLRIALIDKVTFPREKICGDANAAYIPKVLNTIDPALTQKYKALEQVRPVNVMRFYADDTTYYDVLSGEDGKIIERKVLDNFLFNEAASAKDVEAITGVAVKKINIKTDGAEVLLENRRLLKAALFVGCDGTQGISYKTPGNILKDKKHYFAAIRTYYEGVEATEHNVIELHFLKRLKTGYFWIFPMHDGSVNVGLGMLSERISQKKIDLKRELDSILTGDSIIAKRFKNARRLDQVKGFGLPLGSKKRRISGERFMLCGDAASLIDPLTGEGIGQAIVSGRYAGWQAKKCFEQNNFSEAFMKKYDDVVYKKMWKEHRLHLLARKLISTFPFLLGPGLRLTGGKKRKTK